MAARKPKKSAKRSVKAKPAKAGRRAAKAKAPPAPKVQPGLVSHTELASADPAATKAWAEAMFGWTFTTVPLPDGEYHMWQHGKSGTGGGLRRNNPPEAPGTIPYVEVADIQAAYAKALKAGAAEMLSPVQVPVSGGWIAIVQAPGGPAIGLWASK